MRKKHYGIFGLLLLAVLACARTANTTPVLPPHLPAGQLTQKLTYDERERSYIQYVPESVDWNQPVALVFVFHGGTGNAQNALRMSGFNKIADANGFVVIYPNGTGRLSDNALLTWNAGKCCAYASDNHVDDVGFVRQIVVNVQAQANIDSKRIYATGLSNGAMLSQRLACEAADIFAAVAPVAGTLNVASCSPSESISVIEFHGTSDENVPYNGGVGSASLVGLNFSSVKDTLEFWTSFNKCQPQPQTNSFNDIQHQTWTGCTGSTSVQLYTVVGGGHAWPGGQGGWPGSDKPTTTISASQLIWDFFAAHPKP